MNEVSTKENYGWMLKQMGLVSKINTRRILFMALCASMSLFVTCNCLLLRIIDHARDYQPFLELNTHSSRALIITIIASIIFYITFVLSLFSCFVAWSFLLAIYPNQFTNKLLISLTLVKLVNICMPILCIICIIFISSSISNIHTVKVSETLLLFN